MRIIAHRAKLGRPLSTNTERDIDVALRMGMDVEIDIRESGGILWVGHDEPEFPLAIRFFEDEVIDRIWFHAKDERAAVMLPRDAKVFFHGDDRLALVFGEERLVWLHPKHNPELEGIIASGLDPARVVVCDVEGFPRPHFEFVKLKKFHAVCTDWSIDWHSFLNSPSPMRRS